ncbi:MAG: DEAD/DEAH box helicase family protein [Gammaproteobacteria bacterium]|nr:DEAD/DEAH box helicase family protein [Gammaproteobacteria bacterium]
MEERELYVYSTETYLKEGLVKVGHCLQGRYKQRIKEQFGTSNPELPIILWNHSLPQEITDKHIHGRMEKNGIKKKSDSAGQEWFYASTDQVKQAFNEVVFGESRVENYQLRKEQQAAVDKACKWFSGDYSSGTVRSATHKDRFLLNAKMRFGKCFTGLHVAKEIGAKNTLIMTYKPEVISEWMEAANGHVDFSGWLGIRAKKRNGNSIEACLSDNGEFPPFDGSKVLGISLQDLAIDTDGKTKIRLEQVVATHWDLVIFDEVHFGSRTERAKHIIDSLESDFRLDLSGTPFRLIQEDDFCSQQVFTYSYLDEKKNKQQEIDNDPGGDKPYVYREMPDLDISTIEITQQDIAEQRETFLTDDLDFSLNELFKATKSGFVYNDAVDHFLDGLTKAGHDARAISVFGKLGSQLGAPPVRHSVWWLNRVDSVAALAKKLRKHPCFSRFEIINASGCEASDGDENSVIARDKTDIEKKIQAVHGNPNKLGTITLTCRRFLTGVTIKEWDSILVLNDVKSAESYYQAIFRVQSAWVDKKSRKVLKPRAWVFDFAISRCLRITYEYASALADQLDQQDSYEQNVRLDRDNLTDTVTGLCDTLDIKRFYEGSLNSDATTAKDIFEALNLEGSRISLAKRITSDVLVNFGALKLLEDNPYLYEVLKKVKGYRTQEVGTIEDFVHIGIEAEELKNKKKRENTTLDDTEEENKDFVEKEKDKERKSRKKWYATQIKRLAICMADFIYMTYEREYNIDDVIKTKNPHFFWVMTGISQDDFAKLCDKGFVNRLALNRIVREFRDQEETSLLPEEYIFENLKMLNEQRAQLIV